MPPTEALSPLRARFWRDAQFWWLAAAALPVWAALGAIFGLGDADWVLTEPARFAWVVLAYPLLEELAFRGALQPWLLRYTSARRQVAGISMANVVTSVVFAAAHLFQHAPAWAAAVLIPSLAFGYVRDRFDAVAPAIVLHVFYNLGYFLLLYRVG